MKVGFHVSIAKAFYLAINRALNLTCDTFQVFTGSPRMWQERMIPDSEYEEFQKRVKESKLSPIFAHTPYLHNYSSPNPELLEKSQNYLEKALVKCEKLTIPYLVIHCGSHKDTSVKEGIQRISKVLSTALSNIANDVMILLENESGAKNSVGSTWEELASIIERVDGSKRLGICFDTCHAFVNGYDLQSDTKVEQTLMEFEENIDINRLHLIHANDSKGDIGSHLDRHAHIGQGYIGLKGFKAIVNHSTLRDLPFILETPRKSIEDDLKNIQTLRGLQHP